MECLIRKLLNHRRMKNKPVYQSLMLQKFIRGPLRQTGVPTATLIVHPQKQMYQFLYKRNETDSNTATSPRSDVVIHVEILVPWACRPAYSNFLVYASRAGSVIGFFSEGVRASYEKKGVGQIFPKEKNHGGCHIISYWHPVVLPAKKKNPSLTFLLNKNVHVYPKCLFFAPRKLVTHPIKCHTLRCPMVRKKKPGP